MADSIFDEDMVFNPEPSASGEIKATVEKVKQYARFGFTDTPAPYNPKIVPISREKTAEEMKVDKEIEEAVKKYRF